MAAHDHNKDSCLEYSELESMLLEMSISFKPQIMENILIREIMDIDGKKGKITFETIRHVIGDN